MRERQSVRVPRCAFIVYSHSDRLNARTHARTHARTRTHTHTHTHTYVVLTHVTHGRDTRAPRDTPQVESVGTDMQEYTKARIKID